MQRTAIVFLVLGGTFTALAAINEPVKLDSGLVTGTPGRATDTRVFKGIPFAAAMSYGGLKQPTSITKAVPGTARSRGG